MKKLFLFLFLFNPLKVNAIIYQTRFPNNCVSLPIAGSTGDWDIVANAQVEDAIVARMTVALSSIAYCSSYNFNIPSGAIITGIQVAFKRDSDAGASAVDNSVRIYKAGIAVGNDKATFSDWTAGTLTYDIYGSSSDLWGVAWTADDINNSGFGSGLSGEKDAGGSNPFNLDVERITVYFLGGTAIYNGTIYNGALR